MATNASHPLTFEQALSRAASLCSTSEHCLADISEKLARWGMTPSQANDIMDRLLDGKFIDEGRYAEAYARDKLRFAHWGRVKIRMMLRMQHIPDALIRAALEALDRQEYSDIARQVVGTKVRSMGGAQDYAARAKVMRFAMQRGFEPEEIRRHMDAGDMELE